MLISLLLAACAPTPTSIVFDAPREVVIRDRDRVPLARATVLDPDGKPIAPQPRVKWHHEHNGVIVVVDDQVVPVADGTARLTATVGPASASYDVRVDLDDRETEFAETSRGASASADGCAPSNYGSGVYLFRCGSAMTQTTEFAKSLSGFLVKHPDLYVRSVTAMPKEDQWNRIDGFLVTFGRRDGE